MWGLHRFCLLKVWSKPVVVLVCVAWFVLEMVLVMCAFVVVLMA